MSFLQELKRRKVVRTTVAYLGAAFITAQAVQLLIDGLDLPAWILKATLIVLVVGFPLVIGLAWAFDITPDGVERTNADATSSELAVPWRRIALPLTATVLLLVAAAAFIFLNKPDPTALNQNLVAVMPFRVSGDPQIAYLREGMVDLLAAKLTGEGGPRAADARAVLSAVKRAAHDSELDDAAAQEIGVDLGAGKVLVGSVVGTSRQLQISAKILDARNGRVIVEDVQPGSADSLLVTVDRLVAKLLSLQAGEGPQRLDVLTTTSLPALRAYLDGQAAFRSGHFARAIDLFGRALDTDSSFALAAMGQWISSGWGEGVEVDHARLRRILVSNRDRLSSVDRLFANALAQLGERRATIQDRLADWEAVIKAAPDRADAWFSYADIMTHWGRVAGHQDALERADVAFNRVLQLDSTYLPALLHRMDNAFFIGRLDEFRRLEQVRKRLDPDGNAARYQVSWRAHILGDSVALKAERAALDTMSSDRLWTMAYVGGTAPGAVADAVRAIDKGTQSASSKDERIDMFTQAAQQQLLYGMPGRAARALHELRELTDPVYVDALQIFAALYANGDVASAEQAAQNLSALPKTHNNLSARVYGVCALEQWRAWHGESSTLRATSDLFARVPADSLAQKQQADVCARVLTTIHAVVSGGDVMGNARALDELLRVGPRIDATLRNAANIVASRAAERAGDRKLAYQAMSRFAHHPDAWYLFSTMQRESARLAALNGDKARAIRGYTYYLTLQELAEPALKAENDAARAHLAQLTAER